MLRAGYQHTFSTGLEGKENEFWEIGWFSCFFFISVFMWPIDEIGDRAVRLMLIQWMSLLLLNWCVRCSDCLMHRRVFEAWSLWMVLWGLTMVPACISWPWHGRGALQSVCDNIYTADACMRLLHDHDKQPHDDRSLQLYQLLVSVSFQNRFVFVCICVAFVFLVSVCFPIISNRFQSFCDHKNQK